MMAVECSMRLVQHMRNSADQMTSSYSDRHIAIDRVVMSLVGCTLVGHVRELWLNGASKA